MAQLPPNARELFKNWNFREPKDQEELEKWWAEVGKALANKGSEAIRKIQQKKWEGK